MRASFLSRSLTAVATSLAGMLLTAASSAHVELTSPNGGEVLQGQSTFLIEWYDIISHGTNVTYDLEFSVDRGVNWTLFASDLPYSDGISSFVWTVPDVDTSEARIRVTMKLNANDHWEDISDGDFFIHASYSNYGTGTALNGVVPTLTAQGLPAAGAVIQLQFADCQSGATIHLIAGTTQLSLPRFGVTLLTNADLAHHTLSAGSTGMATLPATLPPNVIGLTVHLQAVVESSPSNSASAGLMFTVLP